MAFKMKGMDFGNSPIKQDKVDDYQGEYPYAKTKKGKDVESILLNMEKDIAERKGVSVEEIGKDQKVQDYLARQRKKLLAK